MRIMLINPPRFNKMPVGREDRCENTIPNVITPHGLVYLAGVLEKDNDISLIDANGYNLDFDYIKEKIKVENPELIVFKTTPETFNSDINVSKIAKYINNNIKTVMICFSLITVPEKVLEKAKDVDVYIIDYDYEKPVLEIASNKSYEKCSGIAYRSGKEEIEINPPSKERFNFNNISMPPWDLLHDLSIYWVQVPSISPCVFVESMKGCGMGCMFCTIADIKPNFRDVKNVLDEIEYLENRGVKFINFFDATFNINKKRVFEICDEFIERDLNIKWFANIRANISKEEAQMMKNAGCRGVSVGIESGSQKILDNVKSNIKIPEAENTIKILKNEAIKQYASFIVGLPGESLETMNETKEFISKVMPTGFQVNSLVPYPKSKIYEVAVNSGKIKKLNFEDLLLYDAPISLCELDIEEINDYRKKIYKEIYLNPRWWISNIRGVIDNPEDLKLGIDYTKKVIARLRNGVEFEN